MDAAKSRIGLQEREFLSNAKYCLELIFYTLATQLRFTNLDVPQCTLI